MEPLNGIFLIVETPPWDVLHRVRDDLASRRVCVMGSTPHPNEPFMQQVVRTLTAADDELLADHHVLICDRDAKWSAAIRSRLGEAGLTVVQTPFWAPNANASAERFVGWIKNECLNTIIPSGERPLRRQSPSSS